MANLTRLHCFKEFMHTDLIKTLLTESILAKATIYPSLIACIFVLIANSLLIYGLIKTCKPLNMVNRLFLYLSIMDMLSAPAAPFNSYLNQIKSMPCWFIGLEMLLETSTRSTAINLFSLISVLRSLSIWKPFYRVRETTVKKVILILMFASLVQSVALSVPLLLQTMTLYFLSILVIYAGILATSAGLITMAVNCISYILLKRTDKQQKVRFEDKRKVNQCCQESIIQDSKSSKAPSEEFSVRKYHQNQKEQHRRQEQEEEKQQQQLHQRHLQHIEEDVAPTADESSTSNSNKIHAVKTLLMINVFYIILYTPFSCYLLYAGINMLLKADVTDGLAESHKTIEVGNMMNIIAFSNSGVNALIYLFRNRKIVKYFRESLTSRLQGH